MIVTIDFEKDGIDYKIERGRKPNIFKYIKNGIEKDAGSSDDESQGEGRHTQEEIERSIGISHDMFKHILALNTYVEPFLSLKTNDQRIIIEQLLGITKLSEKAEKLKEEIKKVKEELKQEEFRITAVTEANKRIKESIKSIELKSIVWERQHNDKLNVIQQHITKLLEVNIDEEIELHKIKKEISEVYAEYNSLTSELKNVSQEIKNYDKQINQLKSHLAITSDSICPICKQDMDKETHTNVHDEYQRQINELSLKLEEKYIKQIELTDTSDSIKDNMPDMPETFYKIVDDAYNHKSTLDTMANSLEKELDSVNPYIEQIESLKNHGLQEIDLTKTNELVNLKDHQEFLLKLLTNKDSFIRKKIIDQNLSYLNHRLAHYLEKMGLPHLVKFKSDLEVEISLYGKEFDFDNLSRGERTRLILSLSWSFRDVYESLYDKINLLFLDEILDQGLDSSGVENALSILKKMSRENKRNIYLVSHRDELMGRVTNVLKVIKSNGYTSLELFDEG